MKGGSKMFELDSKAIRLLMLEKKMTFRALAKAACITETTAQKIVRGARVNAKTAGKIADALGVDAKSIIKDL